MNKANFRFYNIFYILILSSSIVNGQSVQTSYEEDSVSALSVKIEVIASAEKNSVNALSVKIEINPSADNILFPTTDSTFFMNLYRNCETTERAIRDTTLFIDTSKTFIRASFENIPYGKYCLMITFMKFGLRKESIDIELPSDSTFTVLLKPKRIYSVVVTARPERYSLYGAYLKSKKREETPSYSLVGESDVMSGRITFTLVGAKRWKIKLGLANENEDRFAEFGRRLSINSFSRHKYFFEDSVTAFEWIHVEKVE